MTELSKYDTMTSDEIDQHKCDLQRELQQTLDAHEKVQQEKLIISRDIVKLELQKQELNMSLSKSRNSIKQLEIEIALATSAYWTVKRDGR